VTLYVRHSKWRLNGLCCANEGLFEVLFCIYPPMHETRVFPESSNETVPSTNHHRRGDCRTASLQLRRFGLNGPTTREVEELVRRAEPMPAVRPAERAAAVRRAVAVASSGGTSGGTSSSGGVSSGGAGSGGTSSAGGTSRNGGASSGLARPGRGHLGLRLVRSIRM